MPRQALATVVLLILAGFGAATAADDSHAASVPFHPAAFVSSGQANPVDTPITYTSFLYFPVVIIVVPPPTLTPTPSATPSPIPSGWVTVYADDFSNPGAFPGPWRPSKGYGYQDYLWGRSGCRYNSWPASVWAVGGGPGGSHLACGAGYPPYSYSWLVYGPFSLEEATAAELRFKLWLNTETGYDGLCRMASVNEDDFYGYCSTGVSPGWVEQALDLAAVPRAGSMLGALRVWIAFVFLSDGSTNLPEGAYVDDVLIRACATNYCPRPAPVAPSPSSEAFADTPSRLTLPAADSSSGRPSLAPAGIVATTTIHLPVIMMNYPPATPTPTVTPTFEPAPTEILEPTPTETPEPVWVTILSEDFEGGFPGPWQLVDRNGSIGGDYVWGQRFCDHFVGYYGGWAIGGGGSGQGLDCYPQLYFDDIDSWMIYGPFSLADASAAELRFYMLTWMDNNPRHDQLCALASTDNAHFYGDCFTGNSIGWQRPFIDLSAVPTLGSLMGQPQVWIAFSYTSRGSFTKGGRAYIDDIVLRKCITAGCTAAPGPR